ncbi:MAG: hypothetical protein R3267_12380 [Paenisporosarcina sp.]|nr:hypothetical protein [Paenisporosarcina sp.]
MKKLSIQFAALLFFSGVLLFGLMHVAIAIASSQGVFVHGLMNSVTAISGWIPYLLSIVFMASGGFILNNEILNERDREESKGKVVQYVGKTEFIETNKEEP